MRTKSEQLKSPIYFENYLRINQENQKKLHNQLSRYEQQIHIWVQNEKGKILERLETDI